MRRLLSVLGLVSLLLLGFVLRDGVGRGHDAAGAQSRVQSLAPPVTVIAVPGLRWSDVTPETTPQLHRLATTTAAVGSLSVKARSPQSCPADGFLTLGAGARAEAFDVPCGQAGSDRAGLRERNLRTRDRADVDALATGLRGACVLTSEPFALLAAGPAARSSGYYHGGETPPTAPTAPGTCPVEVIEYDAVTGEGDDREAALELVDLLVEDWRRERTLLVLGISGVPGDTEPHLHVALAAGPGFGPGALRSASTRRDGYVQLVDVAPTVLSLLGLEVPDTMVGQPWRSSGAAPSLAALVDEDLKATVEADVRVPFFVAYLALLLGLLVALWRRRGAARVIALAGAAVPTASYAANLVPWWRTDRPLLALLGLSVGLALLVALPASRLRGRLAPVALVLLVATGVVAVDLLAGAPLQLTSVAGYSPLVAGRFAGIGNVAFGVLVACAVLGAAATRSAPAAVLVGGLVAVVDGAPGFGSDVGGVLALMPAFAVLVLRLQGRRVSVLRVGVAALLGAAVVTAFAIADRARPPDERTHLGRFAQQVIDGEAGAVLRRKADAVFGLLFLSPVTALLPLAVALVVYLVVRPPAVLRSAFDDAPAWRSGLVALGVACLIGFALNDSGAAVPALALVVALPATAAVVLSGKQPRAAATAPDG